MKQTLYLLAGLLLAHAAAAAELDREAFIRLGNNVLKVEARRVQGGYSLGSGVVVAADKVVTNCHVTRDSAEVYVVRGEARWRATRQAVDVTHDLCVLQVPGLRGDVVPVGRSDSLKVGQRVTAVGFTGGLGIQNSTGEVVALHDLDGARVVQSSNWFSSGASGGGLFDADLQLVGILTFRLRGGAANYYAAPAEWLTPLLADASAFREVTPLDAKQLAYWQRPVDAQPAFLQAALLERDRKWPELEALSARLIASHGSAGSTGGALPHYWRGLALAQMNRLVDARQALEASLALEPAAGLTWFQLGLLYMRQGMVDRARDARAQLAALKSDIAEDLASDLGKAIDKP